MQIVWEIIYYVDNEIIDEISVSWYDCLSSMDYRHEIMLPKNALTVIFVVKRSYSI